MGGYEVGVGDMLCPSPLVNLLYCLMWVLYAYTSTYFLNKESLKMEKWFSSPPFLSRRVPQACRESLSHGESPLNMGWVYVSPSSMAWDIPQGVNELNPKILASWGKPWKVSWRKSLKVSWGRNMSYIKCDRLWCFLGNPNFALIPYVCL